MWTARRSEKKLYIERDRYFRTCVYCKAACLICRILAYQATYVAREGILWRCLYNNQAVDYLGPLDGYSTTITVVGRVIDSNPQIKSTARLNCSSTGCVCLVAAQLNRWPEQITLAGGGCSKDGIDQTPGGKLAFRNDENQWILILQMVSQKQ